MSPSTKQSRTGRPVFGPKNKPQPKRQKRQQRITRVPVSHDKMVRAICAVTDPFCPEALGAKWPGIGSAQTLSFQARYLTTVTTGAGGNAFVAFFPWTDKLTSATWTTTGVLPAMNTGDATIAASTSNISKIRIVSAGARIWDIASGDTSGGYLIASNQSSYRSALTASSYAPGAVSGRGTNAKIQSRRTPMTWISKPQDDTSRNFAALTTAGVGGADNWSGVILDFSGGATTAVAIVETVINYEYTIENLANLTNMVQPTRSSTSDSQLPSFVDKVFDRMPAFTAGASDVATRVVHGLASTALNAAAAYFGGPAGAFAASSASHLIMDVD